jgi:hypothetical protein
MGWSIEVAPARAKAMLDDPPLTQMGKIEMLRKRKGIGVDARVSELVLGSVFTRLKISGQANHFQALIGSLLWIRILVNESGALRIFRRLLIALQVDRAGYILRVALPLRKRFSLHILVLDY